MEQHLGKIPDMPFSDALLHYARALKRNNPRAFTRSARYRLKHLQECFGKYNVADISLRAIEDYMDARLDNVTLATIQRDVSTLRAILNKAYREGFMHYPPRFPRFKKQKPRDRWLSIEGEQKLVSVSAPHLVPLIRFAVDTGGRTSELLRLYWRNVDMRNKRVHFTDTKNGEDRTVRLCDRALATLASLEPKDLGSVFTFRGRSVVSVRTAFNKARKKAGLDDVRFHDLRHTFASRLVQAGVPLYDVMHMTGHKSLEMVQRYSHLAPDYQERALEALNSLGHDFVTVPKNTAAQDGVSH